MKKNESTRVCIKAELSLDDAIAFLTDCKESGKAVGDYLADQIHNFLAKGDNHHPASGE